MDNVIAFPRAEEKPIKSVKTGKAMTLFFHVKNATLILHLSGAANAAAQSGRAVES